MDRPTKWASGGSLAWLLVAVGLTLGTHGGSATDAPQAGTAAGTPEAETVEAPAVADCPGTPVATSTTRAGTLREEPA